MIFPKVYCPHCRRLASGTVETLQGIAGLHETTDGLEYDGETDVDWNSQEAVKIGDDMTVFYCSHCHQEFGAVMPSEVAETKP